jgi:cytochrome c5
MTVLPDLERDLVHAAERHVAARSGVRPRRYRIGRRVGSAIALTAGTAVVLAVVIVIASAGRSSRSTVPAAPASAVAALNHAARAAAIGPKVVKLRRGQAWYIHERGVYASPALHESPRWEIRIWRAWNGSIGTGGQGLQIGGIASGSPGFGDWDPGPLLLGRVYRTPASALQAMRGTWTGFFNYGSPGVPATRVTAANPVTELAKAATLLGTAPISAASRAALFRAIELLPGLRFLGAARDPLGRAGVAVAVEGDVNALGPWPGQRFRIELIFDPATGAVLGFRTVAVKAVPAAHVRAGALIFAWAYEGAKVVPAASIPELACRNEHGFPACQETVRNAIAHPGRIHRPRHGLPPGARNHPATPTNPRPAA